ncbi:hypothetical protein PFISCL1PPCAC_18230, partial [Pristionchus fissidentatus]
ISSERFLESFAVDPNIKYSFHLDFPDYEARFQPSKEFLERILPRFSYFRLESMEVNSDWLFDLILIGLTVCEK